MGRTRSFHNEIIAHDRNFSIAVVFDSKISTFYHWSHDTISISSVFSWKFMCNDFWVFFSLFGEFILVFNCKWVHRRIYLKLGLERELSITEHSLKNIAGKKQPKINCIPQNKTHSLATLSVITSFFCSVRINRGNDTSIQIRRNLGFS